MLNIAGTFQKWCKPDTLTPNETQVPQNCKRIASVHTLSLLAHLAQSAIRACVARVFALKNPGGTGEQVKGLADLRIPSP